MAAADAAVYLFRMPNVFLEAWARGVPVLSLQCDPGGQIAARDASWVAGGSHRELVRIADLVSRDQSLRRQLGRNGRRYVNEVHDPVTVGDQWMTLFEELLGRGELATATPGHPQNRETGIPALGASSLR